MKMKSKILAFILSVCLLVPMFGSVSNAASGSVSVSSVSGNVGSTVTVSATVKCSSGPIGAATVVLTYNSSGLQYVSGSGGTNGGSGSVTYAGYGDGAATSLSFSMKFKILKEGTYSISGSADGYNWDEEQLSMSVGSGSVTGKAVTTNNNTGTTNNNTGTTNNNTGNTNNNNNNNNDNTEEPEDDKDNNSKLKSLKVSPGSLSPAFSANTKSYTVTVPEDTTSVTISAAAQSSKAKVSTSGGKDLKLGPNAAKVVVTAEDGSTTVYNLTIMCGEIKKISMNGQDLVIDEGFAEDTIPSGFVKTKVTYDGREYTGLKHEKNGLLLMALKNDVKSAFYIFKQETQEFYPFVLITIAEGKQIIPLELYETEAFADMTSLTVQGKAIDAWKIDEEFSVINAMTLEGEEILYKYDQVDGTFQRYSEAVPEKVEEVVEEEKQETFLDKYSLYIIIALAVVVAILLVVVICLLATRKQKHSARRRRMQKKLEKQSKQNNEE